MNRFLAAIFLFSIYMTAAAQSTDFSYTPTCFGQQTTLVGSSALPDTAISSWMWDLDGNGTYEMTGKTIISLFTTNDTLAVSLKVIPNFNPADSVTKNVIIDPLPLVNFLANNLCETYPATYISQSTISSGSITQFLWDFNNDGIVDDNSNDTVSYICGPAQTYVTKLTCVSDKGCSSFTQKVTTVNPNPTAAITINGTCLGDSTKFENNGIISNPDYFIWDFGDGAGNVSANPSYHTYSSAGNYPVQLIAVTQAGCRDTAITNVTINPVPDTKIIFVNNDSLLFDGSTVTLSIQDQGGNAYTWSTGDVTASITIALPGVYQCTVTNGSACSEILSKTLYLQTAPDSVEITGGSLLVTPNGDGYNDFLMIENLNAYANCDLKIYNVWNDEVFSTTGYNNDWGGTNKSGALLPAGAYYYMIQCDEKPLLMGNINILR